MNNESTSFSYQSLKENLWILSDLGLGSFRLLLDKYLSINSWFSNITGVKIEQIALISKIPILSWPVCQSRSFHREGHNHSWSWVLIYVLNVWSLGTFSPSLSLRLLERSATKDKAEKNNYILKERKECFMNKLEFQVHYVHSCTLILVSYAIADQLKNI